MEIVAFTDGSVLDNGKASSCGGIGVVFPGREHLNVSAAYGTLARPATNNRTELGAVLKAIEIADEIDPSQTKRLLIKSDSQLTCNTVNKWLDTWYRAGWRKADGKQPLNMDLLNTLHDKLRCRPIRLQYVRAHTGGIDNDSYFNNKADRLAKAGMRSGLPKPITGATWTV